MAGFIIPALAKGAVSKAVGIGIALVDGVLLSTASSKLFGPKVPKGDGFTGLQVTTRSALEFRKIVYGRALVSGPVVYNNLSGTNGEYLWFVVALCDGESDAIEEIWVDGRKVEDSQINWTPGTGGADGTGNRNVNGGDFFINSNAALRASWYLGETDQPASGALVAEFDDWTTDHRLRGTTYVMVDCLYNEQVQDVWETGTPQQVRGLVKGRKIYDPRLDSTNGGSGLHRYDDSTTWEWSENSALCTADYLTQVKGVNPATKIDWASVSKAANDCDVLVTIPSGTEKRFTCNGALSLGSSHKQNIEALLSSFDGKLSYFGGRWKMRASVWEASTTSITEDDFAGDLTIRGSAPKSERFNTVRGFYVDPDRNHEAVEFNHITSTAYVARDNGETIERDLELPFTNSETMAQRIAYRLLEQGNNQLVADGPLKPMGANIAIGDVVDQTFPRFAWTNKTFRVVDWARNNNGTVPVVLREDDASDYDDPTVGEYETGVRSTVTVPASIVAAPSGLSTAAGQGAVELSWSNPGFNLFDNIEIWASDQNDRTTALKIGEVSGESFRDNMALDVRERFYWIRAVRDGVNSAWHPTGSTAGVSGIPLFLATWSLTVDPDFELSSGLGPYWQVNQENDGNGSGAEVQFLANGGANSSNAIRLVLNDGTDNFGNTSIKTSRRFPFSFGDVQVRIRYKASAVGSLNNFFVDIAGFSTESGGTEQASTGSIGIALTSDGTWQTLAVDFTVAADDDAQFWEITVGSLDGDLSASIDIDSVFVYPR